MEVKEKDNIFQLHLDAIFLLSVCIDPKPLIIKIEAFSHLFVSFVIQNEVDVNAQLHMPVWKIITMV